MSRGGRVWFLYQVHQARWNWWTEPSCRHGPRSAAHRWSTWLSSEIFCSCKNGPGITAFCFGTPTNYIIYYIPTFFSFFFACIMEHQKNMVKLFHLGQWPSWWLLHWTGGRDVLSTLGGGHISKRLEASIRFWCLWKKSYQRNIFKKHRWVTTTSYLSNATVDGSEIPNNHLGCIKPSKHINWCRISSINRINWDGCVFFVAGHLDVLFHMYPGMDTSRL